MNTININLYDYKLVLREIAIQKLLASIVGSVVGAVVLCGLLFAYEMNDIKNLENEIAEVNSKVGKLTSSYNKVQELKKKKARFAEVISGIDGLRIKRGRTTELLEDLGRTLPDGVWLKVVEQKSLADLRGIPPLFLGVGEKQGGTRGAPPAAPGQSQKEEVPDRFIEIRGQASDDQSIVRFVEKLRTLPYFDHVFLVSTKQAWLKSNSIREFKIYSHMLKPEQTS